ncbi:PGF-CTERM-anchored ABC transporter substrate-binding protein [Haloplanus sp. GCM10025708]|uniref:PGF-CTERM-anchored ABC transporter substrate-binding protein n=1 Tax=Haloferacaceae TaxID=1644056 RepID=UPI00361176B9
MTRLALAALLALVVCASPVAATSSPNDRSTAAAADVEGPPAADLSAAESTCDYPVTETDATGTTVTLPSPPNRIVTLQPSAAQTVWEIGGKEQVVGVTEYADYLSGTGGLTKVGSWSIDTETVVGLEPDLVLAPNSTPQPTIDTLRSAGLTVFHFGEAGSLTDIYDKTELTGRLVGRCDEAENRTAKMRGQVARIREATSDVDEPSVYYFVDGNWWTVNDDTFIHMVIETAGGRNLGADADRSYYQVNPEQVIADDPEWIVQPREFDLTRFSGTTAVSQDQVVILNENYISQPAPRIVIPMVELVEKLHPEAYRDAGLGSIDTSGTDGDTVVFRNGSRLSVLRGDFAYLRVLGGDSNAPVVDVPAEYTDGHDAPLKTVRVASRERVPVFTLLVNPLAEDERPATPANVTMLSTYEVQDRELRGGATSATYTFDVDAATVNETPGETLSVYRVADGEWRAMETQVDRTNGTVRLTAESDGVSAVGVGVSETVAVSTPTNGTAAGANGSTTVEISTPADTATSTPTDTPTPAGTATPTSTSAETPAQGPGFGVLAAVLSLLATAIASATRR